MSNDKTEKSTSSSFGLFNDAKNDPIVQEKGKLVSDCMLQQMMFTVAGVGVGLALYVRTKSFRNFVIPATLGTIGDSINGYVGPCRTLIEDYNNAVKAVSNKKSNE